MELISIHIPKTAGTAFRKILYQVYGEDKVFVDYVVYRGVREKTGSPVKVIHGHFPAEQCRGYYPEAKKVVWLRDPITRVISHYFFLKYTSSKQKPLDQGVKDGTISFEQMAERFINFYTENYLANASLDDFFFVGIQEFFAEDVAELGRLLDWPKVEGTPENMGNYKDNEEYQKIINDERLMAKLIHLNQKDIEFYREALRRRDDRLSRSADPRRPRQKILVAGLPCSGASALFNTIYKSLPGHPRQIIDRQRYEPEPGDEQTGVIAKIIFRPDTPDREVDPPSWERFDKKILVVRDPRDRLINAFLDRLKEPSVYDHNGRLELILEKLRQKEKDPQSIDLLKLCHVEYKLYKRSFTLPSFDEKFYDPVNYISLFKKRHSDYFLVKYEDLIRGNLKELEDYLGFEFSGTYPDGSLSQEGLKNYGYWQDWLTSDDVLFLKPLFHNFMEQFAYDPSNWEFKKSPVILPSECSEYVEKIVSEKLMMDEDLTGLVAIAELKIKGLEKMNKEQADQISVFENSLIWRLIRLWDRLLARSLFRSKVVSSVYYGFILRLRRYFRS